MTAAKALTLHAPYGDLILEGVKRFETRSTRFNYRGRLWIHNALSRKNVGSVIGGYGVSGSKSGTTSLGLHRAFDGKHGMRQIGSMLPGHVIGYVDVVDCLPMSTENAERDVLKLNTDTGGWWRCYADRHPADAENIDDQIPFGIYRPGRWAIELANPVRVDPFPAKGSQARPWNLELPDGVG